MPTESRKPLIVISYAHADEPEKPAEGEVKWLSFVSGYLRPAIKQGAVDLWIDRLMPGGADWEGEIEQKLRACDIFILLVSPHSLSSNYIAAKEVAIIRERQARREKVHFYPVVLTPTPKIALDLVKDKNLRPRDGKPLSDFVIAERYRQMSDIADEIADIAGRVQPKSAAPNDKSSSESVTIEPGRSEVSRSVFICYRRDDAPGFAGRIYDRLVSRLGRKRVFFDIHIRPGLDFLKIVKEQVSECDVLLAVLGKTWLTTVDEQNQRRVGDPEDLVRIEIETALSRGIIVIPVLVDGAAMPRPESLPDPIKPLAFRQALEISHTRFDSDVKRLIDELRLVAGVAGSTRRHTNKTKT